MSTSTRATRVAATRDAIITTAERLFAEHGVAAVSNRQISEAAGQGNNTAVGYHFGTKGDLVRAIVERHLARIEAARIERIAALPDEPGLREWVECFVMPTIDHLGTLGERTWFARFAAQVLAEPSTREVIADQAMGAPSLRQVTAGLDRCLPDLPAEVLSERKEMVAQLAVVVPAVREARLAAGASTARDTWHEAGLGLVDAIVGLYEAEYTGPRELPAGSVDEVEHCGECSCALVIHGRFECANVAMQPVRVIDPTIESGGARLDFASGEGDTTPRIREHVWQHPPLRRLDDRLHPR
ncbi:transcriptional regulator, TetR family [Glycomyces sambucus]|uniref:Transcriptional regulator, TetR family n=1 Tax=Glycomyces sambucus TaxID=380244 RepID=A0A1G9NAI4_9ACTN|nr:TetR family transcriptional regulator [Glycomyces sambucus]SDL83393.1 transcriptional regulator, TetR family [Glycomyces sambucus]